MPNNDLRLCGSSLLNLILEARNPAAKRSEHLNGISDPSKEYGVFGAFIRILYPTFRDHFAESTLKGITSDYKQGKANYNSWICFDRPDFWDTMQNTYNKNINEAINRTYNFCVNCLDYNDDEKMSLLGRRILELIKLDSSISDDTKLYIKPKCQSILKGQIVPNMSYSLHSLILGAWYYVIENRIPAEVGKEFYQEMYDDPGEYKLKVFKGKIGNGDFAKTKILLSKDNVSLVEETNNKTDSNLNEDFSYLGYYSKYLDEATTKVRKIKTILYRSEPVDFYKVFVCNNISKQNDPKKAETFVKVTQATPKKIIDSFGKYLTISAAGGYGKSMLLKHLFLCEWLYKDGFEHTNLVPILLNLKDYKKNIESLPSYVFYRIKKFDSSLDYETFCSDLKAGRFMLLFDALDELPQNMVSDFISNINSMLEEYGNNVYIISSRPTNISDELSAFSTIILHGFEKEQGIKLIKKFTDFPEDKINGFVNKLNRRGILEQNNPLLLTIQFMIFVESGQYLKRETYKFYEKAYEVLFSTHDQIHSQYNERQYQTFSDIDKYKMYLAEFCYLSFFKFKYSFERNDIEKIVDELNQKYGYDFTTKQFINDAKDNLCLLYYESGKYSFIHRSFQEYFTALFISKQKPSFFNSLFLKDLNSYYSRRVHQSFSLNEGIFAFFIGGISSLLQMIYDINSEKMEKYIILPCLAALFENDENDFLSYMRKVHPSLDVYEEDSEYDYESNQIHDDITRFVAYDLLNLNKECSLIYNEKLERLFIKEYQYFIIDDIEGNHAFGHHENYPDDHYMTEDGDVLEPEYTVYEIEVNELKPDDANCIALIEKMFKEEYVSLYHHYLYLKQRHLTS